MQPNKKYLASDGYENFMCPMTTFKITQGENVGTHRGTRAVDFASETPGKRAAYYAPATVKCISTYPSSGQAIWQTVNKVHCPNGYFGYVTFCTVHDDSFDAYVGMVIPQGNQLGNMGTKGNATGVHLHIEFIQSVYPGWVQNGYGIWTFNGRESDVDDTFYVDDTNILTPMAGNWRKCGGGAPSPTPIGDLVEELGRATFRNNVPINIHQDSPAGAVVGKMLKGNVQDYRWKYVGNGHRYIVWEYNGHKRYCAISGTEQRPVPGSDDQWATFSVIPKPQLQPQPQPKPEEPKPEFSDNPNDDNFLEKPDIPFEVFNPKSKLFDKYGIKLVTNIITKDLMPHKCPFVINKQFTITHNAGTPGNPSAETLSDSMDNTHEERSWHFSVDESTIVQNIPLNRNSWAAGDYSSGWKSKNGINIEICRDMDGENSDKFSIAERNGAILVAELMYQNGWDKETIKKHQDFANKYCPHKTLDLGWNRYVDMVMNFLNEAYYGDKPQEQEKEEIDYGLVNKLIKLVINLLNKIIKIFK